ncbi:C6 transcription factor [Apiospora hydei]|uniref:C6 transcription factor n=1 Tax=Apiospora hydei TaxID=1337664 RepID=A0ABR1V6L7_9PEZI
MTSAPGSGSPHSGTSSSQQQHPTPHVKRTRVLLSCGSCRASKLKCDRLSPCNQCTKKGRPESCAYAPRPEKPRPVKGMAARLKRLEGMVRGMIDVPGGSGSGSVETGGGPPANATEMERKNPGGQVVVQSERSTNYVGGTHFMAILEDLDELKNYFEDSDDGEEIQDPFEIDGGPELVVFSMNVPRTREDLLALLPHKSIIDRLMLRYFNSNSPSQRRCPLFDLTEKHSDGSRTNTNASEDIIHMPTFSKEYAEFWRDPSKPTLHWIAILFMITALGLFFSIYQAPHELEGESDMSPEDRFKLYRGAAGWALVAGKYNQPGPSTVQAFILYAEGDFLFDRHSQVNCYLLCATLIRLMLKMGLHRDPSKVPNLSVYDGEMRRRWWHLTIQIDLLVGFHLGLPCMIHGIESDTALPRNLRDEDFDQKSTILPPARPDSDYTPLTYPINKARISRVFGLVAKQAHALKAPTFAEVMRVDGILEEAWKEVPHFMKVKPISQCVTDPVMQVVHRFGLALLYQKSRVVLHRRYLTEVAPSKEQGYSRRTCLEAALALVGYQRSIFEAARPGAMLHQNGWLSLAIWKEMALKVPDCKRAVRVVDTILKKTETMRGVSVNVVSMTSTPADPSDATMGSLEGLSIDGMATNTASSSIGSTDNYDAALYPGQQADLTDFDAAQADLSWIQQMDLTGPDYDWSQLETLMNQGIVEDRLMGNASFNQSWMDQSSLDDLDFMNSIS